MKSIFIVTIIAFSSFATAQGDYISAFKAGDAAALGAYLDSKVELCIFNKEDIFDRQRAVSQLKIFFTNHKVKSFKTIHHGDSKGKASYSIGELITDNGKFRIYTYFDGNDANKRIVELRIDN